MIRRVYSDLGSFKTLEFHKGLNIILADKTINATDRQSRNGAGKTSFVELVHFMMGADVGKDSIFRHDALIDFMFYLEFDLGDQSVTVGRSGRRPSRIQVEVDDSSSWPFRPRKEKQTELLVISNEEWRAVLGEEIFGIPAEKENASYHPTFRMIFPYFARRENSRGFLEPARHSEKQQENDQQVGLTFLLGLDWSIPHQIEQLRQKEKAIAELRKIARQGTFPDVLGKAAALRTRMTVARGRADRLRNQLGTFRVVPEYRDLERESSNLTLRISNLSMKIRAIGSSYCGWTRPWRTKRRQVSIRLSGFTLRRASICRML